MPAFCWSPLPKGCPQWSLLVWSPFYCYHKVYLKTTNSPLFHQDVTSAKIVHWADGSSPLAGIVQFIECPWDCSWRLCMLHDAGGRSTQRPLPMDLVGQMQSDRIVEFIELINKPKSILHIKFWSFPILACPSSNTINIPLPSFMALLQLPNL